MLRLLAPRARLPAHAPARLDSVLRRTRASAPAPVVAARRTMAYELTFAEELHELSVTKGKPIMARKEKTPLPFPVFEVHDTSNTQKEVPAAFVQRVTLVMCSHRAIGAETFRSWAVPFAARVSGNNLKGTKIVQLSMIDHYFMRIFRSWILKDMKKNIEDKDKHLKQTLLLRIGDVKEIREQLGLGNRLVGYVFLVDHLGQVRWRASGEASAEDLAFCWLMLDRLIIERTEFMRIAKLTPKLPPPPKVPPPGAPPPGAPPPALPDKA
mmetsp:Transcript_55/g.215  ORF Transcript_55/g.215 Transcript_55/m.215 type:complete len:268 (+) Transcript_55:19-822(+)